LEERLRASTQMLMLSRQIGNVEQQLQAHAWLVVDLLEQGDRDAVDAQIEAFSAGASRLRQPVFVWQALVWRVMRAMLAGRLSEAEALAADAYKTGGSADSIAAAQYYAIHMLGIRREQDSEGELELEARAVVEANPHRPAWRIGLAELLLRAGREEEARECFEVVAATGFAAIPRDGDWMTAAALAAEVAVGLRDAERAAVLYDMLIPYRRQNVVIGLAAHCLGSCERYLGKLAALLGRTEQATEHLRAALEANAALGATVELAHTQLDLAAVLGNGAPARRLVQEAAQTARELDLPAVARRAASLPRR
jgi:tetratricopeptide (TPR) repeat protein